MKSRENTRLCIISFDFLQPRRASQARKTRFFRELYGYTQRIKRRLKDGQVIVNTYHYPGLLDQIQHIKLGRSVFAVQPGFQDSIIALLQSYEEVAFYHFIGWLPNILWPSMEDNRSQLVNRLISGFGYISVLLVIEQTNGSSSELGLLDYGFDADYLNVALEVLEQKQFVIRTDRGIELTKKGKAIVGILS